MGLEVMLTQLEVTHRGELHAGFRKRGSIFFPNWRHVFPSRILGTTASEEDLEKAIAWTERLEKSVKESGIAYRDDVKRDFFWIYWVYTAVKNKGHLPEQFLRGNYAQQARWRLGGTGRLVTLNEDILEALDARDEVAGLIKDFREQIDASGGHLSRLINGAHAAFADYDGKNIDRIVESIKGDSFLRRLKDADVERMWKASDSILRFNQSESQFSLRHDRFTAQKKYELHLEGENPSFISSGRSPTIDEMQGLGWMSFDIEIPHFMLDKPEISWVGMSFCKGEDSVKEIYTMSDLNTNSYDGYDVLVFDREEDLVGAFTDRMNDLDPDVVSAYNAKFDLIKMREKGFGVGENSTTPLYRVTIPFFERIGIKDRLVIDPMHRQKIARNFEINAKLETAAGFEKSVSYQAMAELEHLSRGDVVELGDEARELLEEFIERSFDGTYTEEIGFAAARITASYLASDVDRLEELVFSEDFKEDLEDALWIADFSKAGIEQVMHTTSAIREPMEKDFFSRVGTYRHQVPAHFRSAKRNKAVMNAKNLFRDKVIGQAFHEVKKGLYENVHKVYIPVSDIFKNAILRKHPKMEAFFDYKDKRHDERMRLYFLEQYGRSLLEYAIIDYGMYVKAEENFDKIIKDIPTDAFESLYEQFASGVSKLHKRGQRDTLAERFSSGKVKPAEIAELVHPDLYDRLRSWGLGRQKLSKAVNAFTLLRKKTNAFYANHRLFPNRRFVDRDHDDVTLRTGIDHKMRDIRSYMDDHGHQIVAQEGYFLYLTGKRTPLDHPESPVIRVDTIEQVFNADSVYYRKHGFTSNLTVKDEPTFLLTPFEMRLYDGILDRIFGNEGDAAGDFFTDQMWRLIRGEVPKKELLFYNKSREQFFYQGHHGKEYFVLDDAFATDEICEKYGRRFFHDFCDDEPVEDARKVYVMGIDEIDPNLVHYKKRIKKRGESMINAITPQLELF